MQIGPLFKFYQKLLNFIKVDKICQHWNLLSLYPKKQKTFSNEGDTIELFELPTILKVNTNVRP